MPASAHHATTSEGEAAELVRAAFRDLHGPRLHGFALLITLGNGARAAHLAADALAAGYATVADLQHPERAAAWLRARVVREAGRRRGPSDLRTSARLAALSGLEVDRPILTALSSLSHLERAALVAAAIERLDIRDVAKVVGRSGARLDALLHRARRTYATRHAVASSDTEPGAGPITRQIREGAARAIG